MTDIVKRLRTEARFSSELHTLAADEIERQKAEIEQLRKTLRAVYDWCGHDAPDHEEIERILGEDAK